MRFGWFSAQHNGYGVGMSMDEARVPRERHFWGASRLGWRERAAPQVNFRLVPMTVLRQERWQSG